MKMNKKLLKQSSGRKNVNRHEQNAPCTKQQYKHYLLHVHRKLHILYCNMSPWTYIHPNVSQESICMVSINQPINQLVFPSQNISIGHGKRIIYLFFLGSELANLQAKKACLQKPKRKLRNVMQILLLFVKKNYLYLMLC